MNAVARERLVEKIAHIAGGLPVKMPLPVIAAHDFMDGNDDRSSIAVHVHGSQAEFHAFRERLLALSSLPGVIAVLVEIYEIMPETWPYSERVYIVTDVRTAKLTRQCEALQPSDVGEGWSDVKPPGAPELSASDQILSLWWD